MDVFPASPQIIGCTGIESTVGGEAASPNDPPPLASSPSASEGGAWERRWRRKETILGLFSRRESWIVVGNVSLYVEKLLNMFSVEISPYMDRNSIVNSSAVCSSRMVLHEEPRTGKKEGEGSLSTRTDELGAISSLLEFGNVAGIGCSSFVLGVSIRSRPHQVSRMS